MVDKVMITVLVEDSVSKSRPHLLIKHELSFFVEAKIGEREVSIDIKDVRPSSNAVLNNVEAMGMQLQKTEVVVLSHGRYDHVGARVQSD